MNIFTATTVQDRRRVYINLAHVVTADFVEKGLHLSMSNGVEHLIKMTERDFQMIMFSGTGTHGTLASGDFWYENKA